MKKMDKIMALGMVFIVFSGLVYAESSVQGFLQNIIDLLKDIGNTLGVLMLVILGIQLLFAGPDRRDRIKEYLFIIVAALLLINLADVIVDQLLAGV
ncbi:MAG: hypothetical protein DRP73_03720 [Candidatus Omnitrophota bacterium]|nr:MAG: hypothetical protein DRP73_03720 [Candidatus Omnitrophota bacterium]